MSCLWAGAVLSATLVEKKVRNSATLRHKVSYEIFMHSEVWEAVRAALKERKAAQVTHSTQFLCRFRVIPKNLAFGEHLDVVKIIADLTYTDIVNLHIAPGIKDWRRAQFAMAKGERVMGFGGTKTSTVTMSRM